MGDCTVVRLGDVGFFATGGTPSRKHDEYFHGDIPWVTTVALNGGHISVADAQQMITNEAIQHSATKLIRAGSILVGIRVGVGKVAITDVPMCSNQDIVAISDIDHSQWDIDYLCYAIRSQSYYLLAQKQGATISGISSKLLKSLEIECPSLERQHSIVSCLRMIESQIAIAEQMLAKTDELIQSRFVEMFGDLREPSNIEWHRVDDIASTRLGKMLDRKKQTGKWNKKYLGNHNVQWFGFDLDDLSEMDFAPDDQKEFNLQNGDILMCEGGEVGRCAVWRGQVPDCYFQKALHRLRCDTTKIIPDYLVWTFRMMAEANLLTEHTHAVTIAHLPSVRLKALKVPVPPLAIQNEFAEFVTQVESLKATARQQLDRLNTLYDSLAQRYFA